MFQRVRDTVSNRYATAQTARRKRITRRRIKASAQPSQEVKELEDDDYDDAGSVHSTITVETTRTASNENKKQLADPNYRPPTQVFVEPSQDVRLDPIEVLERAQSDITKLSIYLKGITIGRNVASACFALVRGDNRSWEAIAVDILRQKARWESITIEDCQGEYLDSLQGFLIQLDQTSFLHLSNLILTPHAAWTFQSLAFSKSMTKLQLDLIDLSFAMPLLCKGLCSNTSLECLIASRCGLNDDRLAELFANLPSQLKELRIFGNKCREKGLASITAVIHHTQHLQILDLSYQHIDLRESDAFDVSWLLGALHRNKTLKVLDLDNDGIDDGHLTHLCAALCVNTTLEEVMLNHNRITATGIALLSSQFGQMKGLKKISMYSNLFDAPQADRVVASASAATSNHAPTPKTVDVSGDEDEEQPSDLEDELENDDDFDEETVVEEEEEEVTESSANKDDTNNEEDGEDGYMSDNSSTPPPSADFREPSEAEQDSIDGNEDENDDPDEQEATASEAVPKTSENQEDATEGTGEEPTGEVADDENNEDDNGLKEEEEKSSTIVENGNGRPASINGEEHKPLVESATAIEGKSEDSASPRGETEDDNDDEALADDDEEEDSGDNDDEGLAPDEEEDSVLGIIVN